MSHVDTLGQTPSEKSTDAMDAIISSCLYVLSTMTEIQYIRRMQQSDTWILEIIKPIDQKAPSKTLRLNYKITNGILYRQVQTDAGQQLWSQKPFCCWTNHRVAKIMKKYYFPYLKRYVKIHINIYPKWSRGKQAGMLHSITLGQRSFETINIDNLGSFPRSFRG